MTKRVRKDEMLRSEEVRLDKLVKALLVDLGAVKDERDENRYTLSTKLGPLHVHPDGHNIFCRFEEPTRAVAAGRRIDGLSVDLYGTNLNPYSGKWNHHFFGRIAAEEALRSFRWALLKVVEAREIDSVGFQFNLGAIRVDHPSVARDGTIAFANGFGPGVRGEVCALAEQWGDAATDFWTGYDAGWVLRLREDGDGDLPEYVTGLLWDGHSSERVRPDAPRFKVRDIWRHR